MVTYKIDQEAQSKVNTEIQDMERVLAEIPTTLKILQNLLNEHEASLSTPTLNRYRQDLQNMIPEAMRITHLIAINSQRLSSISNQVAKQLAILDGNVRAALVSKTAGQTQPVTQAQGSTRDNQSFKLFQRQS